MDKISSLRRFGSFAVFAFGFATNPIIVLTLPPSQVADFTLYYSLASAGFSFCVWALYLKQGMEIVKKWLHWLLCAALLLGFLCKDDRLLFIVYPGLIVSTDYMITQFNLTKLNKIYRYALVLTLLPFAAGSEYAIDGIILRAVFIGAFGILAIRFGDVMHPLKIKSPLPFVVICYTGYSLPLASLPLIIESTDFLRYWYISYQIGIAVLLKFLDYCTRATYEFDRSLIKYAYAIAICCPLPVAIYTGQFWVIAPYAISITMLGYAFKLLKVSNDQKIARGQQVSV